ncbi:MAG: enoyl-CoA hydratase/isomerase family protein [Pseudomonadota bacterium]
MALIADLVALGGAGLSIVEFGSGGRPAEGAGVVRVGVHRRGPLPDGPLDVYDVLLSADPSAPRPWVGLGPAGLDAAIVDLESRAEAQPAAVAVAAQVMRMTQRLPFEDALALESLAYSALLASGGFRRWREANPVRDRDDTPVARVRIDAGGPELWIRLARPTRRNAFDARMRDELCETLAFAVGHPDAPPVNLAGEGPCFSAGGDLDEFGQAADGGEAHLVRTLRSPALLVHELGERITAHLHGACIGAGIEVPAAAARVVARPGAHFRLPEVGMGLIPGAGGTASIPRRIGRRRATWLAITGAELDLAKALAWGLVDEVAT